MNLEGSVINPPQAWPPAQVTPKDWRRTCCPPTDSFFLNMATTPSPYSWAPLDLEHCKCTWRDQNLCWVHGNKDSTADERNGALDHTNLNLLKMQKVTIFPRLQLRPEGSIEIFSYNSESCCYFCKMQPEILLILKRFLWTGFVKFSTSLFFSPRISKQSAKSC